MEKDYGLLYEALAAIEKRISALEKANNCRGCSLEMACRGTMYGTKACTDVRLSLHVGEYTPKPSSRYAIALEVYREWFSRANATQLDASFIRYCESAPK